MLLGALPFDVSQPAALMVPTSVRRETGLPDWPTEAPPRVRISAAVPPLAEHRARITRARDQLTAPQGLLHKVVLARALQLTAETALDPRVVLRRLMAADPTSYGYLVDLTAAGDCYTGAALVGASPELLVARFGDQVTCQPFAGSAPRSADPEIDAANATALAGSAKNRHEHQLVIDTMREALEPLCDELKIAPEPELTGTAAVWHLCTPVIGKLRDTATTAIDLALALHPTPRWAVCRRTPPASSSPRWRATAVSTREQSAGATRAVTATGWCPFAAHSCQPTGAPRWRTPVAALSPNPIPMTKSTRPQRNSPQY